MPSFSRHHAGLTLALALCVSAATQAQQPVSPMAQDSLELATARRLLQATGAVDVMLAAIRSNLPAQRAATPQLPAEFWTRFETRIVEDAPQLLDSIAVLYARTFTETELAALAEFFGSAVGQRLREVQPALVAASTAIGQRWGSRIGAEIGASMAPKPGRP